MITRQFMAKLLTHNEIFDHISDIRRDSNILLLDETRFESILFLNTLLSKINKKNDAVMISCEPLETDFKIDKIELEKIPDLTTLSVEIASARSGQKFGEVGIIIHNYLPHILVRDGEESVLRMIEHWLTHKSSTNITEFFTLPQSTFPNFEKKLRSLTNGTIVIELNMVGEQRMLTFSIHKSCKPEYHMEKFPFVRKDGRLLIKWGEDFTDKLPKEGKEEIEEKTKFLKENLNSLIIQKSKTTGDLSPSPYDRWMLSQIQEKPLKEVFIIFPEMFEDILSKLARWNIRGLIKFEKCKESPTPPVRPLGLLSKVALSLPVQIGIPFLRRRSHTIPIRVYHTLRESVESFISEQMPDLDFHKELQEVEMYFQELTARRSAIQTFDELGEDIRLKWDLKLLPKVVSLTLFYGYKLKPKIKQISEGEYDLIFKDCFICSKIESEQPCCQLLTGTIVGCCAVVFKEKFICNETECKAIGDDACVFNLKILEPT